MSSMMRIEKHISRYLLLFMFLILQGCSNSDDDLWGLSSFVFLVFVCAITINKFIPRIQEISRIQIVVKKIEFFVNKIFPILVISSFALIFVGGYTVLISEYISILNLLIFIGIVCLYLSITLKKWASENDTYKKRNYVRRIGLGVSFLLILIYVMFGASNIKL